MPDKSITKVSSEYAPKGRFGQKYLAPGIHISIRFWEREQPAEAKPQTARDCETVGLVFEGKAELHIEGQLVLLEKGRFLGGAERVTAQLQGYRNLYCS